MLLVSDLFEALNKQLYVKWEMGAEFGKQRLVTCRNDMSNLTACYIVV